MKSEKQQKSEVAKIKTEDNRQPKRVLKLDEQQHLNALPEEFITTSNTWWPVPLYGFSIPVIDTSYFSRSKKFGEDFYEYDGFNNCYKSTTWPFLSGMNSMPWFSSCALNKP